MDEVDIYIARNSLRANSSSIWRNNGTDIFSRSSTRDDYDDEEALKWAALQKLTTYNRLKKGLLVKSNGAGGNGIDEVDIQNLGVQEKKELLERLMRDSEGGNEKFLLKLRKRLDRFSFTLLILFCVAFLFQLSDDIYCKEFKVFGALPCFNFAELGLIYPKLKSDLST